MFENQKELVIFQPPGVQLFNPILFCGQYVLVV